MGKEINQETENTPPGIGVIKIGYFFSKEELVKLLGDAFDAGKERRAEEIDGAYNQHPVLLPDKEQYINSLFQKSAKQIENK